jgi:TRAP-type C4-dicarboxylate transport system substrate-binding protein
MKQGVADGQENPIGVIKADKLYEVQDQLIITNHMYESVLLIMNSRSWDKLTDEQKRIIKQEAKISGARVRDIVINSEKSDIEELKGHGMNVTYPDLEKFKAMMEAAYINIAKVCGQENVDTMVQFTAVKK